MLLARLKETIRTSFLAVALKVRGKGFTPKTKIDLYFKLIHPVLLLNACRYRYFSRQGVGDIKLHLGSGPCYIDGFVNIEALPVWKSDMMIDFCSGLPFADNSVESIYACHVLEHLDINRMVRVLAECHRVLKPGGGCRFAVPSLEQAIDAYKRCDLEWFGGGDKRGIKSIGGRFNDLMLCGNHHMMVLDASFFKELLERAAPWASVEVLNAEKTTVFPHEDLSKMEGSRISMIERSLVMECQKA